MTITSTTRMTSTNVTLDRGMPPLTACCPLPYGRGPISRKRSSVDILVVVADPAQHPDAVAQCAVQQHGRPVGQSQHNRHHHGGLGDERQAGEPELNTVPPIE